MNWIQAYSSSYLEFGIDTVVVFTFSLGSLVCITTLKQSICIFAAGELHALVAVDMIRL